MINLIKLTVNVRIIFFEARKNFRLSPPPTTTIDRGKVALFIREKLYESNRGTSNFKKRQSNPTIREITRGFFNKPERPTFPVMI